MLRESTTAPTFCAVCYFVQLNQVCPLAGVCHLVSSLAYRLLPEGSFGPEPPGLVRAGCHLVFLVFCFGSECYDGGYVVAVATGWAVATPWSPVLSVVVTDICEIYGHGIGVAGTGLD